MDEKTKKQFLFHSKLQEHKDKVEVAKQIVAEGLRNSTKPYVAYSGGKDSIVTLHLVLQQRPDVCVFHYIYSKKIMPPDVTSEVLRNARIMGVKKTIIIEEPQDTPEETAQELFFAIRKMQFLGYDLAFVGLRREESSKRKIKIDSTRPTGEAYPVANFSWLDVWAYIVSNRLPYPRIYDDYGPILGWDKTRFVTFFDNYFNHFNSRGVDGMLSWRYKNIIKRDDFEELIKKQKRGKL